MRTQTNSYLYDHKRSVKFYEDRYEQGYMDEWPVEKKRKVLEVIQELQLPAIGYALDFGCGNGVLTEIIRQALPSWKIYGTASIIDGWWLWAEESLDSDNLTEEIQQWLLSCYCLRFIGISKQKEQKIQT